MTAFDQLRQTWGLVHEEENKTPGYYYRRVPLKGPFPAYAGIVCPEGACRLSLLAESPSIQGVPLRDETRGYLVDVEPSPAGYPGSSFVHITAKGSAFAELFAILAADILEQWTHQDQGQTAVARVHRRLQNWRRFFQRGGGGLSREEYVGLYAELTFLEILLDAEVEPDGAVHAWQGPLGSNQDFLFGSKAIEVKSSTGNTPDTVGIANERQLDPLGLQALFLFHIAFDFRENAGRTLSQLISALDERLRASSEQALLLLEERLIAAGYAAQIPSPYDNHGFTERKRASYELREDFPRVVESALSPGVTEVSYLLNLAVCSAFQVSIETMIQAVRDGV
jgi:hypothetical protein